MDRRAWKRFSPRLRAIAPDHLAMDDGRAEIPLRSVVGRRDVRAVEEHEQAGAMLPIAKLQAPRFTSGPVGQVREEGPEHEAIDGILDASSAQGERRRGERLADGVQVDGASKQVAQFDRPHPSRIAVGLDHVAKVANLMRQADLMGLRIDLELGTPQVRDPAFRARVPPERRDHLGVPPGRDHVVADRRRLEYPMPGRPSGDSSAGLIRPDHGAGPDFGAQRVIGRASTLGEPPNRQVDPAPG
jgi:hypothetical protein